MKSILRTTKNAHYKSVGREITEAITKSLAKDDIPAQYHSVEIQAKRLTIMYEKWLGVGSVWTTLSQQVFKDQLRHVNNGCFGRPNHLSHLPADSSRNESLHRHLNGIQRGVSGGLTNFMVLASDFVLRRNCRIAYAKPGISPIVDAAQGSHHLLLVDCNLGLLNRLTNDIAFVRFPNVESGETFGLRLSP